MRLQGIDIARFAAFVGMVLVNFRLAAQVTAEDDFPSAFTNLLEGRAAALFVLLAGVGFALGRPSWHLTLRRAVFLFAVGMANLVYFDADILHYYALYFVVAALFPRAGNRKLIIGAFAIIAAATVGLIIFPYGRHWDWTTLTYTDLWTVEGFLRHLFFDGWHPVFPWAAFLLFGMWIGRKSLSRMSTQLAMAGGGVVSAAVLTGISRMMSRDPEIAGLVGLSTIPPGPLYMLAATSTAIAALGLILLATPILTRLRIADWFAAPGRMALTLYLAHIYVGMGVMEELGMLNGTLTTTQIFIYSLVFCALSALFARLWFAKFKRGPLEGLMRIVTQGKR